LGLEEAPHPFRGPALDAVEVTGTVNELPYGEPGLIAAKVIDAAAG
jgi:hypothetical protein